MAKDLEEALVSTKAKLGDVEKHRMDLGAHLEYIESLLERGGGGSVDLFKPVFTEQKAPVPTTGHLTKVFFNRELKPEQVDLLITNANLTFMDIGDNELAYFMLMADSEQEENRKMLAILDQAAQMGLASGTAWIIGDMMTGTLYYVSPALAEAKPDSGYEAGWNKAAFASGDVNYIIVDADLVDDVPIPVGAQNDLLTELFYVYALADSGETELAKSITGQYKIVEKNIKLDTNENTAYSYDFINSINDDTKEISVIKNIEVDIGQKAEDAIINRNITTYANNRVREIGPYTFAECQQLKDVSFPNVTHIGGSAFYYCCQYLTNVEMPLVESIGQYAFSECSELRTVTFPKAQTIYVGAFYKDSLLWSVNLPEVTEIWREAFYNCHSLEKVFISQTNSVCSLASTNVFTGCYHILGTTNEPFNPDGRKDGYIYVPARLLSQYKVAEN